jgi:xanthine dehydrogenase accessory factor
MGTHRLAGGVLESVVAFAEAGRGVALAVVMGASGSTPRKAGTKALVDGEGSIWGTIGGGRLESEARRLAVEALRSGEPLLIDFPFHGKDAAKDEPVCGGSMQVLIDPTAAAHREAYREAAAAVRRRERVVLVTTVRVKRPCATDVVLVQPGRLPADLDSDVAAAVGECLRSEEPVVVERRVGGEVVARALVEPLVPRPLLVVVGGGHVGQAVAEQAHLVGFEVTVIEDRAEFIAPVRFPEGVTLVQGDVAEEMRRIPLNRDTYVALVSRGHIVDGKALGACVRSEAAYIGMMGSRRKISLMRRQFIEDGICTGADFDRVRAPIGLDIGAQTVPEIAASIVAQLIAARRRKGDGKP